MTIYTRFMIYIKSTTKLQVIYIEQVNTSTGGHGKYNESQKHNEEKEAQTVISSHHNKISPPEK